MLKIGECWKDWNRASEPTACVGGANYITPLSGRLGSRYPGVDLASHNAGHLWSTLRGPSGDPHFSLPHLLSFAAISGGFLLLLAAWSMLHPAQRRHDMACTNFTPRQAPAICRLRAAHTWLPAALADAADPRLFPAPVFIYARLALRGKGHPGRLRRALLALHGRGARVHFAFRAPNGSLMTYRSARATTSISSATLCRCSSWSPLAMACSTQCLRSRAATP